MANTFKYNDQDYLYDSWANEADYRVSNWIKNNRGEDYDKYYSAYTDMMKGLKNKTAYIGVNPETGGIRYYDNNGKLYGNTENPNEINLTILGVLADLLMYAELAPTTDTKATTKKKTPFKWSNVTKKILSNIGATNTRDFIDLDLEIKDGVRSLKVRASRVHDAIKSVRDAYDTDYADDPDIVAHKADLDTAMQKLSDGIVTDDDYFYLNKVLNQGDTARILFTNKADYSQLAQNASGSSESPTSSGTPSQAGTQLHFNSWFASLYPEYTSNTANSTVHNLKAKAVNLGPDTKRRLGNYLRSVSTEYLLNTLYHLLSGNNLQSDQTYIKHMSFKSPEGLRVMVRILNSQLANMFIRQLMDRKALIDLGNNEYAFKHHKKKGVYYKYNANDRTLTQVMGYNIPSIAKLIKNEYYAQSGIPVSNDEALTAIFGTSQVQSNKNGGILKFLLGNSFKSAYDAITYSPEDLLADKRLRHLLNDLNQLDIGARGDVNATNTHAPDNELYDIETDGFGEQIENQDRYKNWLKILTSNATVAEAWANRYKELHPTNSDIHYKNWYTDGKFDFNKFTSHVNSNNKHIWDDGANGIGHDFYRGRAYRIKDTDDYYLDIPEGYELIPGDPTLDETGLVNVYQLLKKLGDPSVVETAPKDPNTYIDPKYGLDNTSSLGTPWWTRFAMRWGHLPWDLAAANITVNGNNKVRDTFLAALHPNLHETFSFRHPITGNYRALAFGNHSYGNTMNLAQSMSTTDSQVNNATMLTADDKGKESQWLYNMVDDKAIAENMAKDEKYQYDNMARATENENGNRDRIYANNLEIAKVKAGAIKSNSDTWSNLTKSIGNQVYAYNTERKQQRDYINSQTLQLTLNMKYQPTARYISQLQSDLAQAGRTNSSEYRQLDRLSLDINDAYKNDLISGQSELLGMGSRSSYRIDLPKLRRIVDGINRNLQRQTT